MLQRIYATAFPSKDELKAYISICWKRLKRRDHRKLGKELDLFSVHDEIGAGLVLWHPNLAVVRAKILKITGEKNIEKRVCYCKYSSNCKKQVVGGFPGILTTTEKICFCSKENEDDDQFIIKPMNCPFHILIYASQRRSYRDLPIRMAELGTVYRKEKSGALGGLTRVQGFTQDDAHIFCTPEQIVNEINEIIDFVQDAMSIFNMSFEVELSTRPESYVGDLEHWNMAEAGLKEALDKRGMKYDINEGDGAFYGPKIDFKFKDAIGRTWQCATIQLDFNLPIRFDLKYQDKDGELKTPIMLHRVVFGSMERFHGILTEHYAGAFPTWLNPKQAAIVPIADRHLEACEALFKKMKDKGIRVELDDRSESMNHKIRDCLQNKKIPYVLVVGDKEIADNTVAVRARGRGPIGTFNFDEFVQKLEDEIASKGKSIVE